MTLPRFLFIMPGTVIAWFDYHFGRNWLRSMQAGRNLRSKPALVMISGGF